MICSVRHAWNVMDERAGVGEEGSPSVCPFIAAPNVARSRSYYWASSNPVSMSRTILLTLA